MYYEHWKYAMTGPTKPRLKVAAELLTVALVALAGLASSQAPEKGLSYQEAQNLEAHGRFDEAARAYRAPRARPE